MTLEDCMSKLIIRLIVIYLNLKEAQAIDP